MKSVVVYGDVNANVIDGSSIWLVSITNVLTRIFNHVHLVLKCQIVDHTLLQSLEGIKNVTIHEPESGTDEMGMIPEEAVKSIQRVVAEFSAPVIVARGFNICHEISQSQFLAPLLWAYVTDIPYPPSKLSETNISRLRRISSTARRVFAQTEAARSYLEAIVPEAAGKTVLMPPMIPDEAFLPINDSVNRRLHQKPLRIVYAGKLAREWRTLEMLQLPKELEKLNVEAELEVVGAKINYDPTEPDWADAMLHALEEADSDKSSGVKWLGALPRGESMEHIRKADLGFGWRTAALDSSLEISTKALEYGAAGTVPLVNRTEDHCALWGAEYPFFVDAGDSVSDVAKRIVSALSKLAEGQAAARRVSEHFSMAAATKRLNYSFSRAIGSPDSGERSETRPLRIVVASHDLKFMGELMEHLKKSRRYEVRQDPWETLRKHDESLSRELADWADLVFCEWAGPALGWYSQNISPTTRLISRLHRFELNGPWMKQVRWENVDSMVFVSEWVRQTALKKFGMVGVQTIVIPNVIDLDDFDRPKLRNAEFTLGMVGYVPFLKRPDRALQLLEALVEVDPRYTLRFKGRFPWEYPHVWNDPVQKQLYLEFFDRLSSSHILRERVAFDGFTADVASWFRGVGYILSPSELESFHLAAAEGMASRCIPLLWEREGVQDVFGPFANDLKMSSRIEAILASQETESFSALGNEARSYASQWDTALVLSQWDRVFLEPKQ